MNNNNVHDLKDVVEIFVNAKVCGSLLYQNKSQGRLTRTSGKAFPSSIQLARLF